MTLGKRYIMSVATASDLPASEPHGTQCWVEEDQMMRVFMIGEWEFVNGQTQRNFDLPATGVLGQLLWDSNAGTLNVWDGTDWKIVPHTP